MKQPFFLKGENLINKISPFFTGTTMDYCLLEDAFKENTGCKDNSSTEKAKKQERKKLKRRADCFAPGPTDPDRPAYEKANSSVSLKELSEAFVDVSAATIPKIAANVASMNKLPTYFLGQEDDTTEGFTNTFTPLEKDKPSEKGFEKSAGALPLPSLDDAWKPLTVASNTSYFNSLPTPGGTFPVWNDIKSKPREYKETPSAKDNNLQEKIDDLIKRLNALENERRSSKDNQNEIIAFVGTGIFMIFALHILKR
jgi:hypothetical protein